MNKYQELMNLVTALQNDFEKFYDQGNKAAGTRVRAGLSEIAAYAKATRADVQNIKNAAGDKSE